MRYEVCDTDNYITWLYQIADHNCRITWVYNKDFYYTSEKDEYKNYYFASECPDEVQNQISSFYIVLIEKYPVEKPHFNMKTCATHLIMVNFI